MSIWSSVRAVSGQQTVVQQKHRR